MTKMLWKKPHYSPNLLLWAILYAFILSGGLLYPFVFDIPPHIKTNNIMWLSQHNGVEFTPVSTIFSPSPLNNFYHELVSGDGLTVEVWLSTKSSHQEGPARIVSYSFDTRLRNFTLGQQGKSLVMRLRTTETDLNGGNPELTLQNVFLSNDPYHIVVTYDFHQEAVYVNGQRRLQEPVPGGNFSNWDPSHFLILGNELTGNRSWNGRLFLVAIYNRALSQREVLQNYQVDRFFMSTYTAHDKRVMDGLLVLYLFDERSGDIVRDHSGSGLALDLLVPEELKIIEGFFLDTYFTTSFQYLKDVIVNILVFIPFGFLLHRTMRQRHRSLLKIAAFILVIGVLFTFTIESLQYFVATRYSSLIDVISNTIGIALGIVVDRLSAFNPKKNG